MKYPEEYIKRGKRTLHSGGTSNVLYDVNALLTNKKYLEIVLGKIPQADHYVGIATGGAILAGIVANEKNAQFSIVKDGELKGSCSGTYVLIDDVTTTEKSLREAIQIIGREPERIFVVMDRRTEKDLMIEAMFCEK